MSQGIVTIVKSDAGRAVHSVWEELKQKLGYQTIFSSLEPHFSWHVAEAYPYQLTKSRLTGLADHLVPFEVKAVGLGIFAGDNPVIYIPVVVTSELRKLYEQVYQIAAAVAKNEVLYYQPDWWIPHISLVVQDMPLEQTGKVVQMLMDQPFDLSFQVDNFGLFCPDDEGNNSICEIAFRGKS